LGWVLKEVKKIKYILRNIAYSTLFIFLISGCATVKPLNTPTGKPEVIIPEASKAEIADQITNDMLSWNFQLQKRDENILVFSKRDRTLGSSLLFGSKYDRTPEWRFIYNIVDHPEGIRVIANIAAISNPGSAFERVTDFSRGSKDSENVYLLLTQIRENFICRKIVKGRGKIGVGLQKYTIISLAEEGPAENAGLQKGDVILKIDGEPITGDLTKDTLRITGEPGTTVMLFIKRGGQELNIPVVRGKP